MKCFWLAMVIEKNVLAWKFNISLALAFALIWFINIVSVDADSSQNQRTRPYWVNELEDKVDDLQEQQSDIEALKAATSDIRDELRMMQRSRFSEAHRYRASKETQEQAYEQMMRKVVGLKVDGEKFKAAVHALSNMLRVMAKEIGGLKDEQKDLLLKLAELEKAIGDLNTLTSSMRATDSVQQRELDSIRDGTNDLAIKFGKLRDRINQEIANKQMPPGMIRLKHNQGALATALESMTDKVSSLIGRLPFLEKEMRNTNEKVSNQAMYERELQSKLKVLYKNLIEVKKSVHNLLDPRSAVNMERSKGVLKLKSDVSMLAELDKGLKNELEDQRDDMARLVKDVTRVQLMAQNLKDKLTLVLTASRQFQQDIAILKEGQKNGLSVVEVAQMQKQVLIALNRLKSREAIMMKQLNKYRSSVKDIASEMSSSSSNKKQTQHVVQRMQQRLNRFEKQMELLFEKTKTLAVRFKSPSGTKEIDKVLEVQAQTNAKVMDLIKQLSNMHRHITMLNLDLRETKKAANDEKIEVIQQMKQRELELRQRETDLEAERQKERALEAQTLRAHKAIMRREKKRNQEKLKRKLESVANKYSNQIKNKESDGNNIENDKSAKKSDQSITESGKPKNVEQSTKRKYAKKKTKKRKRRKKVKKSKMKKIKSNEKYKNKDIEEIDNALSGELNQIKHNVDEEIALLGKETIAKKHVKQNNKLRNKNKKAMRRRKKKRNRKKGSRDVLKKGSKVLAKDQEITEFETSGTKKENGKTKRKRRKLLKGRRRKKKKHGSKRKKSHTRIKGRRNKKTLRKKKHKGRRRNKQGNKKDNPKKEIDSLENEESNKLRKTKRNARKRLSENSMLVGKVLESHDTLM